MKVPRNFSTLRVTLLLVFSTLLFSNLAQAQKTAKNAATTGSSFEVEGTTITDTLQVTGGATNGYVLQSDASGNGSWVAQSTLSPAKLADADADTKIQVEESADEDKIRFDLAGTERWLMQGSRLEPANSGNSVFIGQNAGNNDDLSNNKNVGIGTSALSANLTGVGNTALGFSTLVFNTANSNTAIGYAALYSNTSGYFNTALGQSTLYDNTTGLNNVAIGGQALTYNTTASFNVALGSDALFNHQTGDGNVALGFQSGLANVSGEKNVFLGYQAGANETGSDKLYVDNSNTSSPLIWGDFSNNYLNINGNLGIGASSPSNEIDIQTSDIATISVQSSANEAYLTATAPSGQEGAFLFKTYSSGSALSRWAFGKSIASESGSNAGSDFFINRYDDTGSYLGQPFTIVRSTGQVSIATLKATTLQMTTGAANGYVLQSDASGNGSWVSPTSLANGNWTTSGTNQYSALSGNVGVGTASPSEKLHLVGNARVESGKISLNNTANAVYVGNGAGNSDNLSGNTRSVGIGTAALYNSTGTGNVAVGYVNMEENTTGTSNTSVGFGALNSNTTGNWNTVVGQQANFSNITGSYNVALGGIALENNTGSNNVAIGYQAGNNSTGSGNVFIGYQAGAQETGSDKLYVDNSSTSSPLLWGDFSNNYLNVNGSLGIGASSPANELDIQSSSTASANVQSSTSDAYLITVAPSGQESALNFKTYSSGSAINRWAFGKSTAAESSADAGSNFFINRYSDAGSYTGQPFAITRSTGTVTIGQSQPDATASTLNVNGSVQVKVAAITTSSNSTTLDGNDYSLVYTGTTSGNSVTLPTASSYAGRIYLIVNHSSSSVTISTYYTANAITSTSVAAGTTAQLMSDGSNWHKIN